MAEIFSLEAPALPPLGMQYNADLSGKPIAAHVFPRHIHDKGLEIYLPLVEGTVFTVENRAYTPAPGEAVFSLPGEVHFCTLRQEMPHTHFCFWFDAPDHPYLRPFFAQAENRHITLSEDDRRQAQNICFSLLAATQAVDERGEYCAALALLHIFGKQLPMPEDPALPERMQRILTDADAHFREIRTVGYFTAKYFVSDSTLTRWFRTYTGKTPRVYLEEKRLTCAKESLRAGKSVTDACFGAGFSDLSDFIRLFRRRFGITPAAYGKISFDGSSLQLYSNIE